MRRDLAFVVPGKPHGKGRPRASLRGGTMRMYTDAKTLAYEDRVAFYSTQAMGDKDGPMHGPLRVFIVAYRQRPQKPGRNHECRSGRLLEGDGHRLCTSKPDADNIAKSVLDGCNQAGVWLDDVQVADLNVVKLWCAEGETPRTEVRIIELEGVIA